MFKADVDDSVRRGRKYEHQKMLEEARATAKKLSIGNLRIYYGFYVELGY